MSSDIKTEDLTHEPPKPPPLPARARLVRAVIAHQRRRLAALRGRRLAALDRAGIQAQV